MSATPFEQRRRAWTAVIVEQPLVVRDTGVFAAMNVDRWCRDHMG